MYSDASWSARAARARLGGLLLIEAAALLVLRALAAEPYLRTPGLGLHAWALWLQQARPADALAAMLRLAATAAAGWVLAGSLLYVAARITRLPGLLRAAGWCTPAALRRVVDAALALSVTVSALSGGAAWAAGPASQPGAGAAPAPAAAPVAAPGGSRAAAQVPPTPLIGRDGAVPGVLVPALGPGTTSPPPPGAGGPPAVPAAAPWPAPGSPGPPAGLGPAVRSLAPLIRPGPADEARGRPAVTTAAQHVVAAGENLWTIAAAALGSAPRSAPGALSDRAIAPYWASVVAANRPFLRSRDPDLIYPGEVIRLPPVS
jgi:nucleoid-associated protein YgaU